MEGILRNYLPWLKISDKGGLQWTALGGLSRNYPLTKIARYEWAAMGYNGRPFEELPPMTKIAIEEWAAIGCNGGTVEESTPLTKNSL